MIFKHLVSQSDVDLHGALQGGALLNWIDEACRVHGQSATGLQCVVRHIDSVDFVSTIKTGEIIIIDTSLYSTGETSLTLKVKVYKEKDDETIAILNKVILVCVDSSRNTMRHVL